MVVLAGALVSVEAITWALKQNVPNSSTKFVLVVLANCASGDTFRAWPSVAYLSAATGQNRKTIIANFGRLVELGLIRDTGKRTGETGQIPVYGLAVEGAFPNSPENGTVLTVPKTDGNSPEKCVKQSRKRDTETSDTSGYVNIGRGARLPPDWQPDDDLRNWMDKTTNLSLSAQELEIAKFKDHWAAASGQGAAKKDWAAAFRNWIRNAEKWSGKANRGSGGRESAVDRVARTNREADANGR